MNDSILNTIKQMLGIAEDYEQFDTDIIVHINTIFASMKQMGIGPKDGFRIRDKSSTWDDYGIKEILKDPVKDYIYLKVRLIFDPPTSSMVTESIKETLKELEFRLRISEDSNREEETNDMV